MSAVNVFSQALAAFYFCVMATTIRLTFNSNLAFSSELTSVHITTSGSWVDVTLSSSEASIGTEIFAERYYPYSGAVTLSDLASIVEQYMSQVGNPLSAFTISARASDGTTDVKPFNVLFCNRHVFSLQPPAIVDNQFLSSLPVKTISGRYPDALFYIVSGERQPIYHHTVYRRHDTGEVRTHFSVDGYTSPDRNKYKLAMIMTSLETLRAKVAVNCKVGFDVLSDTIDIGLRSFTYFFSERVPDIGFYFYNQFNAIELCELHATTTVKTKVKRSEAVAGGSLMLYDKSVEQTFEVQAEGLTLKKARWLEELFASDRVCLLNRPYGEEDYLDEMFPEVLITDSTSEAQDGDEELNKVKFTYRHVSARPDSRIVKRERIHTDQFKNPFN